MARIVADLQPKVVFIYEINNVPVPVPVLLICGNIFPIEGKREKNKNKKKNL